MRSATLLLLPTILLTGCFRTPEQKGARFLEQGKQHVARKDYARAILDFRSAARVLPADAEPYYQLGSAYLISGDLRAGVEALRKATERNPKHANAQLKLAELMAMTFNKQVLEDAETRLRDALTLLPGNLEAVDALALAEWKLGKRQDAEQRLQEAFDKNPGHGNTSVALAGVKFSQGDVKGAEQVLQRAVAVAPNSVELVLALGRFYGTTNRAAEAEQQIRRALALDPANGSALVLLAALQIAAGRKEEAEQTCKRISALSDARYKPVYGTFLLRSGKTEQAIAEFMKLTRAEPDNRQFRSLLVGAYLAQNKVADAEQLLVAALKKNPQDADALLIRSRIYIARGKLSEAQSDLNQVIRARGDLVNAHFLLAAIHQRRGARLAQKQELGEAIRLKPAFLAARIQLAGVLIGEKAPQSALQLLDGVAAEQKNALEFVVQRNWALYALKRTDELQKSVDEALKTRTHADLYQQKALMQLGQNDIAGARQTIGAALERYPDDARALELLGLSYAAQKQMPAAVQAVLRYAMQRPKSARIHYVAGRWLIRNNDLEKAKTEFMTAKSLDPATVSSDLALAEIAVKQNGLDTARKHLHDAISLNENHMTARLMLASVEEASNHPDAAVAQYRAILKIDPNDVLALNNLAYRLADSAKYADEALSYAQKAKELSPNDPMVDDTLGWIFYQKGLYSMSVRHLENAAGKQPTARHNYHLAMAYFKADNPQRARQALQAAMEIDRSLPEAKTALEVMTGRR